MEHNLNQYKIFYEVAKFGNISHAAENLFISQPAISKAITKLEDSLDTVLFTRNPRGVILTNEGELLFEQLKIAFDAIAVGEEKLNNINKLGVGHIKIGASATLSKYVLLPYLKGFVEKHPHIKISIECQSSFHSMRLLENNKIDIALMVKPEYEKNIDFIPVGEYQDIFIATQTYLDNLNFRENNIGSEVNENDIFKNANLMLLDEENVTRMYVDNYLKSNNIEAKQVLEVSNMDLLIDFAKIGLGIACVIREFVLPDIQSGAVQEISLLKSLEKRTVGFALPKNSEHTNSLNSFMEYIKNYNKQ